MIVTNWKHWVACLFAASLLNAANPQPITGMAAARFLEQASWGPTPTTIAQVQSLGFDAWIDAQIALDQSQWAPIPNYSTDAKGNTSLRPVQDAFFVNAVNGNDQLRQRVAFALAQIWVVSGVKLRPEAVVPYLRLLQADAFDSYDKIMYDVTVSPAMGHYLDMVNNNKPTPGHGANENYAREVLQLFTIGLVKLDSYGRPVIDPAHSSIPTYTQDTIEGFARAFTGWTYAPKPGAVSKFPNPANWDAPMVAFEANHDKDKGKLLLNGYTLPAGQTAEIDLKDALNDIFHHPNVAPFISRQLIQRLVTSQPSDNYVHRVASVFSSTKGDMKAVVKAILIDSEARKGDDGSENTATKLREPVLVVNDFLRRLGAQVTAPNSLTDAASRLGQTIYYPPTVFNYFLPGYDVIISPTQIHNAPEFQLLGEATALSAADLMNSFAFGKVNGVSIDLTPYLTILGTAPKAADIAKMVDAVNSALMGGRMPAAMHSTIAGACQKAATPRAMAETAIYLTGSSWDFQVER